MAFPLPRGITPPEIAFLAEMEQVTIQPRQRLEGLELLGVSTGLFDIRVGAGYFGVGFIQSKEERVDRQCCQLDKKPMDYTALSYAITFN